MPTGTTPCSNFQVVRSARDSSGKPAAETESQVSGFKFQVTLT
jgi:hypothetical protein